MSREYVLLASRERLVVLGIWSGLGLLESAKAWVGAGAQTQSWGDVLVGNMPWWLIWAAFTPLVIGVSRLVRHDTDRPLKFVLVHVTAAAGFSAIHHVIVGALFYYTHTRGGVVPSNGEFVPMTVALQIRVFFNAFFMLNVLTYAAVVAAYYGHEYYRRHREGEVRTARLEAKMHEARLAALRMELNPHFLFNTLHAVAGLVRGNNKRGAIQMLARLSDLLRATLEHGSDPEVPLDMEMKLLRSYLEIEQVRFGDRLDVTITADFAARALLVPPLILQPLVENAIKHGVARHSAPSRVEIRADATNTELVLSVTNTASGSRFAADELARNRGIGLSNTRQRLAEMYGSDASLTLDVTSLGSARATIRMPRRNATNIPPRLEEPVRDSALTALGSA